MELLIQLVPNTAEIIDSSKQVFGVLIVKVHQLLKLNLKLI